MPALIAGGAEPRGVVTPPEMAESVAVIYDSAGDAASAGSFAAGNP